MAEAHAARALDAERREQAGEGGLDERRTAMREVGRALALDPDNAITGSVVVGGVRNALREAEERLYLYAWHLREIVPEARAPRHRSHARAADGAPAGLAAPRGLWLRGALGRLEGLGGS